jgi:hypothetical protein
MHQNKFIQALGRFHRKEMTRFRAFCFSPYFNKHHRVRGLVAYLSALFPKFDEQNCDRYLLFNELFPAEEFDQGKLSLVFTYSQKCLEQFLIQEQLQNEPGQQKILLLRKLIQQRAYPAFEKKLHKQEKSHHQLPLRNADYYFQAYQLAKQADDYYNLIDRRRGDNSLEEKQKNLNLFFLLEKLKDACETKVRQNIMKVHFQDHWMDLVLREISSRQEDFMEYPSIVLYFQIYQMLDDQADTQRYYQALSTLEGRTHLFPREELAHIYIYFMNYCISRINKGDSNFLEEVFKLYKAQLAEDLLFDEGKLSEWDYKNIVTTAIRLGELSWVNEFIEGYKSRLPDAARENAYRFNLAAYYYAKRTYGKVLELLTQVEYSDLRYNLSAKTLLLRTYYDLEEYEPLAALTEAFLQSLMRNKLLSDSRRVGFHHLFKFTKKIAHLRQKIGFTANEKLWKELNKIGQDISQTDLLYNRDWLVEKWEELSSQIMPQSVPPEN